jgi:hypothetical protein
MGVYIIDGTVEAADLRRSRRGIAVFDKIEFRLADGASRTLVKQVTKQSIAEQLKPGSSGRFYLFTGFDFKGVHGVRKSDGTAIYDFPTANATLFLVVAIINLLWIVLRLATDGQIPFLGVGLLILGGVGYTLTSKTQREARRQFDGDSRAPAASPAAAAESAT